MNRHLHSNNRFITFTTFLLGLVIFAIVSTLITFLITAQPVDPPNSQPKTFTIAKGESINSIAQNLQEQHLIKNQTAFKAVLILNRLSQQVQAGVFQLSPSMSTIQIAHALTDSQDPFMQVKLVEGLRREEVATALEQQISAQGGTFDKALFLRLSQEKEGYLFPDTYQFNLQATEIDILDKLTSTFAHKTASIQKENLAHPFSQILIMASLIERETRTDRPIVSGILWKRLANDWPLQVDATLQYAKGFDTQHQTWWTPPQAIDKHINSPYNTYLNQGLPPAPIGNPSLASITAAAYPQSSDYWFYLTDSQGTMHFAVTYQQHQSNIASYLQ